MTIGSSGSASVSTPSGSVRSPTRIASLIARPEMSTRDLVRDRAGLGPDRQLEQHVFDDAVVARDLFGLAVEHDRHVDLDGDVAADPQEVDVQHAAADRVALQVLDDRQLARVAVDLEVDQRVEAGVGRQRAAQLAPVDADGDGVAAESVDGGGNAALAAEPLARTGAGGAAGRRGKGDLSHRRSYFWDRAGALDWGKVHATGHGCLHSSRRARRRHPPQGDQPRRGGRPLPRADRAVRRRR